MKRTAIIMALVIIFLIWLTGCAGDDVELSQYNSFDKSTPQSEIGSGEQTAQIVAESTEHNFCLKLYTDSSVYSTEDVIKIWATLEYIGDEDSVTIWHGDPYIVFSITDGADFHSGGLQFNELLHTKLLRGKEYRFDYSKSGGYDDTAPDADFWEEFYQDDDLKLPAGTYCILAEGDFYLSDKLLPEEKGPSCELQITVQ